MSRGKSAWAQTLTLALAASLIAGCLPDPQTRQSVDLFERLVSARALFAAEPPRAEDGCNEVGDVQTRLFGEPGLTEGRPSWSALRDAAAALQAVCGQSRLLAQPSSGSLAATRARQRWQQGMLREIGVACDHLRDAASALGRANPSC